MEWTNTFCAYFMTLGSYYYLAKFSQLYNYTIYRIIEGSFYVERSKNDKKYYRWIGVSVLTQYTSHYTRPSRVRWKSLPWGNQYQLAALNRNKISAEFLPPHRSQWPPSNHQTILRKGNQPLQKMKEKEVGRITLESVRLDQEMKNCRNHKTTHKQDVLCE